MAGQLTIIYLHGFNSSSKSKKALILESYLSSNKEINLVTPDLNVSPLKAIEDCKDLLMSISGNVGLIGSSMGGLYSTYLAELHEIKSVCINPVVGNHIEKMRDIIGIHKNFHTNEEYLFSEKLYKELTTLKLNKLSSPLSHLCLINMGDEVLNHEITKEFFHSSLVISEKHGSHEYINFRQRIGLLLDFLN
tara:strand:- start:621 stop:1196 length:576 start_codon:yes stop_codon:yes gene_type:complete